MPQPFIPRVPRTCELCGKAFAVKRSEVARGNGRFCGYSCAGKVSGRAAKSHGMRHTPEYRAWIAMRARCRAPNPYYGARGISVCAAWERFENFYADMGPRPSPQHSLDRIDNNGNYEPANCRWATIKTQNTNRSITKLTPDLVIAIRERHAAGERSKDLAVAYGISPSYAKALIARSRWTHV